MDSLDVAALAALAAMAVLAVNVGLAIYNWRLARRYQLLCMVLTEIAAKAFLYKHMPIWIAWSRLSGRRFRMEIEPTEEADTWQ